jgi:hypothetical protein
MAHVRIGLASQLWLAGHKGDVRPMQTLEGSLTYGISEQLADLFRDNEGNKLGAEIARLALPAPNDQPH